MPDGKIVWIFLDTDKHASPFDILLAIDLYPDAQFLHYSNVTPTDAKKIIQDAMFPRGPSGAKFTKVFIGGYDVDKVIEISDSAKKCMFPPFELAIVVDPRGAYTTAAAAVAKTLTACIQRGLGDLSGKTVTILAGTGPVGTAAARLYAMEGADVIVTSRNPEKAREVSTKVNEEVRAEKARGVRASNPDEIGKSIEDADIVLSAGAAGVQLLSLDILKERGKRCKIVADVNAVPPLGIEGLKSTADNVEFLPGIWGIGALPIGTFKNQVEAQLFKRAVEALKGIFDYKIAYEIAKSMALGRP